MYVPLRTKLIGPAIDINMYFGQYSSEQIFFGLITNENLISINELGEFFVEGFRQRQQAQNHISLGWYDVI